MTKSRGGLGRGLASLIPSGPASPVADVLMGHPVSRETAAAPATTNKTAKPAVSRETPQAERPTDRAAEAAAGPHYREIPLELITANPSNPRTVFDEDALAELEHSIREFGLLQPIVVRERQGGYELVMGERRWRAAQRAKLEAIPAIVRKTEDADLLRDALLENIHRADLNPLEEAAAYQQLLDEFGVTHDELAVRLGRSRPVISNTIRLLRLPVPVQRRVAAGVLSAGHARALLALTDPTAQEELAARIVAEGLSVRGTEEAVTILAGRRPTQRRAPAKRAATPGIESIASDLGDLLDTRVLVDVGRKKGRIIIEFASTDDLSRISGVIRGQRGPVADAGRQRAGNE